LADGLPVGAAGKINYADYKLIPYTRSAAPDDTSQELMLSITIFILVKESVDVICQMESAVEGIAGQTTFWGIAIAVIVIILYLVELIVIVAESIKLMQELIDLILPPMKIKLGMRECDLFKKGCEYFGLKFISTIYGENIAAGYSGRYVDATWMPVKIIKPTDYQDPFQISFARPADEVNSTTAYGYYDGTFKQWIDVMCMKYNAKIIVQNNTMLFEEVHYWNVTNPFPLPNEGDVGFTQFLPDPYGFNAHEIPATYIVRYEKDDQELNTYNDYSGTYCLANTHALVVRNQRNQLLEGSVVIQLPCALARRKDYLTKTENDLLSAINELSRFIFTVNDAGQQWNSLINQSFLGQTLTTWTGSSTTSSELNNVLIGMATGGISIPANIAGLLVDFNTITDPGLGYGEDRVGWMLLSSNYTAVPKSFIGYDNGNGLWYIKQVNDPGNLTTYQNNYAISLMQDFHSNNLGSNPFDSSKNNQWLTFKNKKFKMSIKDWHLIRNNNVLTTADGRLGKFDEIMWELHNDIATGVIYRIKENWTNNLTTIITQDNG